jgi:hypothetical protein
VFYLAGYFDELETQLKNHPLASFICKLAHSKGKVTLFFLLEGIKQLVAHQQVKIWMEQENISQEEVDEILRQYNESQT